MKSKSKKLGSPGKVGQVAGKKGKTTPSGSQSMQSLDRVTMGSAMGILNKHFR